MECPRQEKTGTAARCDSRIACHTAPCSASFSLMRHSFDELETTAGTAAGATLFERYRARLFGIAYRMLGTVDDANDLVQECYLRWHQADPVAIEAPEGWLVAVITRLAIDRSRRLDVERRSYVGQWLPQPPTIGAPPPP